MSLDLMEPNHSEYANYWEIKSFWDVEELPSLAFDEPPMSGYCNPSSPTQLMPPRKRNIMMERERRKKFNQKLHDLRSLVPNITKMNKTSVILDAINYIQELQEQERSLLEEISKLDLQMKRTAPLYEIKDDDLFHVQQAKKRRTEWSSSADPESPKPPSIELMQVSVHEMGNGTLVIGITSNKKRNAIVRVCEVVEALDLRIVAANITSSFGKVFHNLVIEADGVQSARLKEKIEATFVHLGASTGPSIIA